MLAMPSTFLQTITLALAVTALLLSLWCAYNSWSLNRLKRTFFTGRNGENLESVLSGLASGLKTLKDEQLVTQRHLSQLHDALGFAVQRVGLVRFNPFAGGGGNFSFSLALLDAHNNGVVITSMHGREQNRIYSKNIINGKSETQFTEEEQQAINLANTKKHLTFDH